jgi:hypothetical protein
MATVKYSTGKKPQNATGKGGHATYGTGKKPQMAQAKGK